MKNRYYLFFLKYHLFHLGLLQFYNHFELFPHPSIESHNWIIHLIETLKSLFFQLYVFTFVKIIIRKRKINQDTLINTYPTASILKPERLFQFSEKFGKKSSLVVVILSG